jgi:hypothetical protein
MAVERHADLPFQEVVIVMPQAQNQLHGPIVTPPAVLARTYIAFYEVILSESGGASDCEQRLGPTLRLS